MIISGPSVRSVDLTTVDFPTSLEKRLQCVNYSEQSKGMFGLRSFSLKALDTTGNNSVERIQLCENGSL